MVTLVCKIVSVYCCRMKLIHRPLFHLIYKCARVPFKTHSQRTPSSASGLSQYIGDVKNYESLLFPALSMSLPNWYTSDSDIWVVVPRRRFSYLWTWSQGLSRQTLHKRRKAYHKCIAYLVLDATILIPHHSIQLTSNLGLSPHSYFICLPCKAYVPTTSPEMRQQYSMEIMLARLW